ncbi:hypothetical protein JOE11_000799 [Robbsia andropogonis]
MRPGPFPFIQDPRTTRVGAWGTALFVGVRQFEANWLSTFP